MNTPTIPFGKHKGKRLSDIPPSYLRWVIANCWIDGELRLAIDCVLSGKPLPVVRDMDKELDTIFSKYYT